MYSHSILDSRIKWPRSVEVLVNHNRGDHLCVGSETCHDLMSLQSTDVIVLRVLYLFALVFLCLQIQVRKVHICFFSSSGSSKRCLCCSKQCLPFPTSGKIFILHPRFLPSLSPSVCLRQDFTVQHWRPGICCVDQVGLTLPLILC